MELYRFLLGGLHGDLNGAGCQARELSVEGDPKEII